MRITIEIDEKKFMKATMIDDVRKCVDQVSTILQWTGVDRVSADITSEWEYAPQRVGSFTVEL